MMMFHDISSLKNSFSTTFGLSGEEEREYGKKVDKTTLTLKPKYDGISEEEAKIIFEKVVEAFVLATQKLWEKKRVNYEFFKDELKIVEYRRFGV